MKYKIIFNLIKALKKIVVNYVFMKIILYIGSAYALFSGDVRLACEAILCLSSKNELKECSPSVEKYYSIKFKKHSKTSKARQDFLNLCPR